MAHPPRRRPRFDPRLLLLLLVVLPGCPCEELLTGKGEDRDEPLHWIQIPQTLRFCCVESDPFPQVAGVLDLEYNWNRTPEERDTIVRVSVGNLKGPIEFRSADPGFDAAAFRAGNPVQVSNGVSFTVEVLVTSCDLQDASFDVLQGQDQREGAAVIQGKAVPATRMSTCTLVKDCVGGDPPPGLPEESRIVFASNRDGDTEIFSMDPDGANVVRHTENEAEDLDPAWAPERLRIAFLSDRDGQPPGCHDLYVLQSAIGTTARLTFAAEDFFDHLDPVWSPDGSKIAFAYRGATYGGIVVIDPDTGASKDLTFSEPGDRWPTWSPDGTRIAFVRNGAILTVEEAGDASQTPQVLYDGAEFVSHPAWSPGGASIAFVSLSTGTEGIHLLTLADGSVQRLTADPTDDAPGWFRDSMQLTHTRFDGTYERVCTMEGSGQSHLVVPGQAVDSFDPDWR
jgi:hypothetical protein